MLKTDPSVQAVVFIDDDRALREANIQTLELAGLNVTAFPNAKPALNEITPDFSGVVVTDIRMRGMDGLQLASEIRKFDPEIPVILITGHADLEIAVAALTSGVFDFISKPFSAEQLLTAIRRGLDARKLALANRWLREAVVSDENAGSLIGSSSSIQRLRSDIGKIARTEIDMLIRGETGTGKETVARLIHRHSSRRNGPFVRIDCGALTDSDVDRELLGDEGKISIHNRSSRRGVLESAQRGTLFLDEIDSTLPSIQAKFVRVLQEREILPAGAIAKKTLDIRIIASSRRNLAKMVASGAFRPDLYYGLTVTELLVPPLREHVADIPALFAHFCGLASAEFDRPVPPMPYETHKELLRREWLGNVRELRNFAYRHVLQLSETKLPPSEVPSLAARVESFEASLILDALAQSGGDIRTTMEFLRIPRKTLYDKIARHGINVDGFRLDVGISRERSVS